MEGSVKKFRVGDVNIGGDFIIVAGPCVIEDELSCLKTAGEIKDICDNLKVGVIFKSSYSKANRSSISSYGGPGIKEGLEILGRVKKEFSMPVISDIHCREEVARCAEILDIIQIPAFLCRQTTLLVEAAASRLAVNVKKGQFLAPWDIGNIIKKIESAGNSRILITERGSCFGYNNLVVDMRSFPCIRRYGYPVLFDGTHSVQLPGGKGAVSDGNREYILPLSRAAAAAGCDGLFLEVHMDPDNALCDGPNMLPVSQLEKLIVQVKTIADGIKGKP